MLELLLANHPLDCPVCDKGGECPLQDQAFSHGPGESRYVEEKRHYEKPIPISDLVFLDRERCILCDRCTRFADEVAGDPLIHFTQRGNLTQVITFPDEPFSSVLQRQHRADLPGRRAHCHARTASSPARGTSSKSESTCTTCSVGCRITVQSSRDQLVRYLGVDCDAGQLGLAVRQGPLRLRGRRRDGAPHHPARDDGRGSPADIVELGDRLRCRRHQGRARRRRRRAASRCSAAHGARTRTPSPGPASPTTSSARRTCRPARRRPAGRRRSTCPEPRSTRPPARRR